MKIFLWSLLALFLIGDALFVLPFHISSDTVTSTYDVNFKKDSLLLKSVFSDSAVQVRLNLSTAYQSIYQKLDSNAKRPPAPSDLIVNVAVLHNLDFTAVSFPFFKVTSFNSVIPFFSIIKASNAPGRDSTALVGNIIVSGKLSIVGICSPVYAKSLVEKELVNIITKELNKVEVNINRHPVVDTTAQPIAPPPVQHSLKKKRK